MLNILSCNNFKILKANLKEVIFGIKEEINRPNNLVFDLIKKVEFNLDMKTESESSKEIDDILKNTYRIFSIIKFSCMKGE